MKIHQVLDLTYTEEEGQSCFVGTFDDCVDFVNSQGMEFAFQIVPLLKDEFDYINNL